MITSLPKLRSDLTIRQQQTDGRPFFIIKDPRSGTFYRLQEAEHFIALQFDGQTPAEEVQRKAESEFGAVINQETLNAFVNKLTRSGLLESGDETTERRTRRHGRIQGSLLYLRVRMLDPDKLFNRVIGNVRFLFTSRFVLVAAASILLGATTLLANWSDFVQDLAGLMQWSSIPLFVAIMFSVISLHEFAHGLTCKHFGGEVHEVGFMLLYFQPALYCNVSDAWLFPEKWKRLWVGLAGPYFELFLWSLAVLAWRVFDPNTWIADVAMIVIAGSGAKTLLNFNPLIKLDGYYLLSDYLEIPNLRRKSFRYVGDVTRRFFGFDSRTPPDIARRERLVYLLYGFVAASASMALLSYVFIATGEYLIESGPLLLLIVSSLLGMRFKRKLRKLFGKNGSSDFPDDDEDFETTSHGLEPSVPLPSRGSGTPAAEPMSSDQQRVEQPNETGNPKGKTNGSQRIDHTAKESTRPESTRRRKRSSKRRGIWIGVAGAILGVIFFVPMELRVPGPFIILPVHNADVRAEIDGMIEEILVTEGDVVQEGDVLVRLSDREHRTELQKTDAQILEAHARLRMQEVGPTREELDVARAAVERAEDRLVFARGRLERDEIQFDRNLISKKEFENTQELAAIAESDLAETDNKLKVLLRGTRKEEIAATQAEIARLEAQKRYLEGQLKRVEVRSPATGTVATPARQLREMVRQVVQKGALIAKVYDFKKLTVEIAVPEKEIADVRVGQEVAFKARAFPNETFYGTVTSIATTALAGSATSSGTTTVLPSLSGGGSSPRTVLVTTEVDNGSTLLKPGMSGQAKVYCGERRIIDLMMRRVARTIRVEFWSWW